MPGSLQGSPSHGQETDQVLETLDLDEEDGAQDGALQMGAHHLQDGQAEVPHLARNMPGMDPGLQQQT